jgi:hypothetical protein
MTEAEKKSAYPFKGDATLSSAGVIQCHLVPDPGLSEPSRVR